MGVPVLIGPQAPIRFRPSEPGQQAAIRSRSKLALVPTHRPSSADRLFVAASEAASLEIHDDRLQDMQELCRSMQDMPARDG